MSEPAILYVPEWILGAKMFFLQPLSLCEKFITNINLALQKLGANKLSASQCLWFSICITGVIVTNSVCWKRFERSCFGEFCAGTISKMFKRSKICWDSILHASILNVFLQYKITKGILALDDTDNKRSKKTTKIAKAHKLKDKASGGFVNGQALTFLILITDKVTIPVGFAFYEPDPDYRAWKKTDKELRKQGISKKERPQKPEKNEIYLTKQEVGLMLLKQFKNDYPEIAIQAILADALYGSGGFVHTAATIHPNVQIITQARSNQLIKDKNKYISIKEYFRRNCGVTCSLKIRGGKEKQVFMHGARLYLKAHGCKRFIVALKYEGEEEYRYLLASELTWRLTDIATAYTLRWLVEVFIQDWKSYEGWCQLAKQTGIDGSCRGVILSLLVDHCLLLHPEQIALIENKLPAATVGSLRDKERATAIIESIESLVSDKKSSEIIRHLKNSIADVIPLRKSSKHMSGRDLGRLKPTASLKYRAAA